MASGFMPFWCLLLALASSVRWMLVLTPPGGGSGEDTPNKLASLLDLEDRPLFLSSPYCRHGDGGGGRARWWPRFYQLGRSSSSATSDMELWRTLRCCSGCSPVSSSSNHLTEWRSLEDFLPAQSWLDGRQPIFFLASMSSTSSRCWRWWHGGINAPSGLVPGSVGVGSVKRMKFGPDCFFTFLSRVLVAKSRDWFVFLVSLCPLWGCFVTVDLI
jgi:hypothetical protein